MQRLCQRKFPSFSALNVHFVCRRHRMTNTTTEAPSERPVDPSPDAVEAFYDLYKKGNSAMSQNRVLRVAEYYGRAACAARGQWGDEGSLCLVLALLQQSCQLGGHLETGAALDAATWLEAQRLLAECCRILTARLSANTCLVGRCFAVEEDFYARHLVMILEAGGTTLALESKAALQQHKGEVGYDTCISAAEIGLEFAYPVLVFGSEHPPPLSGEVRKEAQAFVLRCVGIMAAAPHIHGGADVRFAKRVRNLLSSNDLEQPFKADLARVWDRPALQNALRAAGVFDEYRAAPAVQKFHEIIDKKAAADKAKHGLRWCALPSCAKQEACVFDFKACSACKAVVYCSAEHGALHWTRDHSKECPSRKAAGAKPRSTADDGEGGGGSAVDIY